MIPQVRNPPKEAGTAPVGQIPKSSVLTQTAALRTAKTEELKRRWRELFEVAPFSWAVCRLAGYGSVRAASRCAS